MDPEKEKERKRLIALTSLNLLNTPKEERFEIITRLASKIFAVPVAGISLVDAQKVWFKSIQGLDHLTEDRSTSFSNAVVLKEEMVIIEDTLQNEEFKSNPYVTDGPKIRFFAGVPIRASDLSVVGSLFLADRLPRKFSDLEVSTLKDLSTWVDVEFLRSSLTYQISLEQKKIQEELVSKNRELAEEKAMDDAMLANIGDGVVGINDRGEIIFTNQQVEYMTGLKQDELIGKPIWYSIKMFDKDDKEVSVNERPIRNALFLKKKIESTNYFFVRRDGSKFPVSITATPVIVFDRVIGGVDVFRDITKEKEIDRMKTEFISLASHQLRTPLSAMKWFCEILLDRDAGDLNKEQEELLTNIYQSNERMIQLVNTLLNISRIESGRIIIDPKPTDLRKLLDEVILEVRPRFDKKKQHLAISIHKNLPLVNIDPRLIRHVYMNLLTNAIKYTPDGGEIVIIISVKNGEVVSQVSDSGYGIPRRQHEQVFKKFFRAENVIKIETEVTGFGRYLTKAIVESSGGRIWFESDEGKGTTFWFAVPLSGSVQKEGEVTIDI